jgi:hypothetical protein
MQIIITAQTYIKKMIFCMKVLKNSKKLRKFVHKTYLLGIS